jgi:carbonic anhydrase
LEANQRFAESFDKGDLEIPPARNIAVLTCIDARIDRRGPSGSTSAMRM